MQSIIDLIKDYWVLVVLAILILFVVRFFFRTIFKLAVLAVIVGLVLVFVFHVDPSRVFNFEKQAVTISGQTVAEAVKPLLQTEMAHATYNFRPDGTYEVKTQHIRIVGKKGDPTATVYYGDQKAQVNLSDLGDFVQKQITDHAATQ